MASTDSRPVPIKNTAYRIYFGIYKNDGTLISSAAGLDSEVSKDGAAFADCTNEATEISQGVYYLDLTSTEMNADNVAVIVKTSSTGAVVPTFSISPQETGDIKVDIQSLLGTAWLTPGTAGTPDVNVKLWNGLTTVALPLVPTTAGRTLDVSTGGEAGMDWANIGSPTTTVNLSGTSTKAVEPTVAGRTLDVASTGEAGLDFNNVNLPVGAVPVVGIVEGGTLQSGTSGGAVLRSATAFADSIIVGDAITITGGTGVGQSRLIVGYVQSTKTITIDPPWTTTVDNTSTYIIAGAPPAPTSSSYLQTVLVSVGTGTGQINLSSGNVPATVAGAVGSVTGNVGGNVVGSVASVTGAVGSVTGLTASDVAAIKAKTDSLTFTAAGKVDANVLKMNGATVTGSGTSGDLWRG